MPGRAAKIVPSLTLQFISYPSLGRKKAEILPTITASKIREGRTLSVLSEILEQIRMGAFRNSTSEDAVALLEDVKVVFRCWVGGTWFMRSCVSCDERRREEEEKGGFEEHFVRGVARGRGDE